MSSIHTALSSDEIRRRKVKLILNLPNHASTSEMLSSPTTSSPSDTSGDAIAEYCPEYSHKNHEPHSACPDSLGCLPDAEGRPQHTLPVILRCAILGSPQKRLTIREIYAAVETKYSYYKTAGTAWKQSIRHHLSLNRLFERQPRPVTDPGFGSYWTVNLTAPPGTKRPRKRGRPNEGASNASEMPPRKRGRPRKLSPTCDVEGSQGFRLIHSHDNSFVGPATCDPSKTACIQEGDAESGEERPESADAESGHRCDDGYESEEQLPMHPMDRRASLVGLSTFGPSRSQPFTLPPVTSPHEGSANVMEHLQTELESLRRQSTEAVSLSLRLADQLVQMQAESSRTRETVREIEGLLEDETRRRREAERAVDCEEEKRRKAEDALEALVRSIG